MGNKLGRRRQVVDERYTKPQGLYVHRDVDHKKLRKLILESKLAPCYPGDEEYSHDHEECPICFLYYPSLNRSRCCTKGICTECFLQMKNPNSTRPTQCPFCKTLNYAVEYRGVKTKEEKGLEQIEEQRVIEAKIRMRQQELQDEEERLQKRLELCSPRTTVAAGDVECSSTTDPSDIPPVESDEIVPSHNSIRHPPPSRVTRDDDFDLDLEDIMVMEAIWLSIQENGRQRYPVYGDAISSEQYAAENRDASSVMDPQAGSSSSPSGGLACAIAALAERQQMSTDYSVHNNENTPSLDMLPGSSSFCNRMDRGAGNYPPAQGSANLSPGCRTPMTTDDGEWVIEGSEAAEVGTSYASSDTTEDAGGISALLPPRPTLPTLPLPAADAIGCSFGNVPGTIIPESFEEQMMLAMAVSLAEAGAMTNGPGSTWQ